MMSLGRLLGSYVLTGVRRRQALAIAALAGLAQYFVLVYSPVQLRALAIEATPEARGLALAFAWILWMRSSRVLAWRLVLAADVRMLRHLPIAANRWRGVLAPQLAVVDLALAGTAAYGLAPMLARDRLAAIAWGLAVVLGAITWRVAQCTNASERVVERSMRATGSAALLGAVFVLGSPMLAVAVACTGATWAVWRLGHAFAEPCTRVSWPWALRIRSPTLALARLHIAVAWALERPFLRISTAVQIGAMLLGALACIRVGVSDPDGALAGVRVFACGAAGIAIWSALRTERRVALDRWALDPLVSTQALDIGGRMLAAWTHALPLLTAGVLLGFFVLAGRFAIEMLAFAVTASLWCAVTTVGIAVGATHRDRMHEPRIAAQVVRLLVVGTAAVQLGALVLVLAAAIEAATTWSRWPAAEHLRRRRGRIVGEAERDG